MAAPAYFKVDGVALLNNSPEVDDSTAFCVAVPRLPCVMGRPEAAGSSGKADSGAGPFKVSLVGASKKVSRKHVSVDWNSKIGQYEASVCGSLSITVDGKVFSKTNDDGTAATKAILFAGSALRVGNVLLYFLLPHEHSGSEASPSGPSVQGAASAASDSAPPAVQRPAVSPQLPESAPAPEASRASSSPADDDSSKAGKTPANNSGMTYRQILDLVISSLPPGRWSARDLCNRAVQLLPEGSVTNRTAFSASFKNVLKGLDRFPGDLSAEEHAAAVARGNKRISGALWYVTGPNDVQAALPPHTQAALAARIAELANSGDGFLTAKAGGAPLEAPAAAAAAAASAAGTPAEDRAAKRQREVEDQGQPADAESPAAEAAGVAEPEPKRKPEPPTAVLDGEGGFSL
ncbi:hypothetical protein FNF28_01811 [Cafeteria roenbergensis]|uniref:FHA domain-containing protein n=1 Tax=Cafeteria roenbergensis TaxID=33653 RepID=A0A5A8DWK0_CAFRO|nr:hypothetical protein FNF28_01811 [Cafeteria roenbergensis]